MQRVLVYLVVLIFSTTVGAQDLYYVTLVRGIVRKVDGSILKTGDRLPENEKLYFADNTCRLLLLHPQKGRFVVEAKQTNTATRGEILLFLQNQLKFQTQTFQLSSRGGQESIAEFFSTRQADSSRLLFIGDTRFDLHHSGYEIRDSSNQFFFLQYVSGTGKPINHKLPTRNDSLIITAEAFLFDGILPGLNHPVKLGYVQNYALRDIRQIASFQPAFMRAEACKNLLKVIKQNVGDDRQRIMQEAYAELSLLYGKPSIENLYDLIDQL